MLAGPCLKVLTGWHGSARSRSGTARSPRCDKGRAICRTTKVVDSPLQGMIHHRLIVSRRIPSVTCRTGWDFSLQGLALFLVSLDFGPQK